ncbi:MAG: bifunctional D-glycero-beta-D-manno-heptose-7-phosphate kinase/D-glycero-beta-D-manno-heptose 1-phosphate adenylyltransferase HldE [Gammaproteobacteria bacterium]|nr:bifunctional D-glycero-beta-D-manno-heptose-7-phosphate kinase/D-glycero-beta-D-manno-heptose 1-phosphate adenylyltransferase HldE [Gammaproteobacteria bacterium]
MQRSIPDFTQANVLVIGDLMLDRYWHGDTSRISPEAPVPVVLVRGAEERAGGAGNVALNIAALGATAQVVGYTGDDDVAGELQSLLETAGVVCHFERIPHGTTITKLRVLSRHQQLIRLDFEDGFYHAAHEKLLGRASDAMRAARVVVLSDYGKGTLSQVPQLIAAARKQNIPVLIDPKSTDFEPYRNATLITPNLHEFEAVVGRCDTDAQIIERGMALIKKINLQALLVTRSDKGMTLLQREAAPLHLPTKAREVFDVTGAGDTVIAVLAAALAAGVPLDEATALSNFGAGLVVGKLGTATVSPVELQRAMREELPLERGVVDEAKLIALVEHAKLQGQSVVMTNGCFDILHPGHVSYLQQARTLGDRLIVAVNADASVRKLKGEHRPINDLAHRMAMLAALECVDWIVSFSEDTPQRLICKVVPNILVKGGDYTPEQVAGGKCVIEHGGQVRIVPFVAGHSTSDIIKTILQRVK